MRAAPTSTCPAVSPLSRSWWSPERIAGAIVGGFILLHVLLAGIVPLSPQEAYYWQYARHLDLSYFDHPPLAAWTIRLTTALIGVSELSVRLAAAVHGAIFALFFFLAGRRLFGARVALLATVAGAVTPIFALGSVVITPDAPLLAGWAAALYFTVRALDDERGPWLIAAGVSVGLAALGKYTGWLLAPQIFLALLLDPRGRRMLASPWPYVGLAVASLVFSPVLLWNAQHGWASFGFQIAWRASTAAAFSFGRLGRYLGLQALAVSPILYLVLWVAAIAAVARAKQPAYRICAVFSVPALLLFSSISPFVWVKGNWVAAAYPTALLAAAALHAEAPRARRVLALGTLAVAATFTLYLHLALAIPTLPFPARQDVTTGWKDLAVRVRLELDRLPAPGFVVGCGYKPASELAFYLPGRPETHAQNALSEPGLQYDYWNGARDLLGREGILVLDPREPKNCLRREELCRPLEELAPLTVRRGSRVVTTFRLWRCRFVSSLPGAETGTPRDRSP